MKVIVMHDKAFELLTAILNLLHLRLEGTDAPYGDTINKKNIRGLLSYLYQHIENYNEKEEFKL